MKTYNNKGLYNRYDKNHKQRDKLDYYSTPTEEVTNILNILKIDFNNSTILEPCCGGGHMVQGILNYLDEQGIKKTWELIASDVKNRGGLFSTNTGLKYDYLSDDYPFNGKDKKIDYIIMNPPYSTIEPFVIRSLEIANKGVLMLARLQFLEGQNRYENILKENPPNDVYIYVDRIKCYKNGDLSDRSSSAQAYAWFYWDLNKKDKNTYLHWIRRIK